MQPTLFLTVVSFLICLGATPLVRTWSRRYGVLDVPNTARKVHRSPIPRTGGIAIALAYVAALGLLFLSPFGPPTRLDLPLVVGLLPAVFVVFATGLLDDLRGMSPVKKLLLEAIAACIAYWAGIHVLWFAGMTAEGW